MKAPYHWNAWLDYIAEREVIPILGPELLRVTDEGAEVTLDHWIARRLAARFNVSWPPSGGNASLNGLVSDILRETNEPASNVYPHVSDIVREGGLQPPEWMRKLARIRDFDLFVTTTFDPLMERALNEERFGGAEKTLVINNSLGKVGDLPAGHTIPKGTTLVHLMGKMSTAPYFALTDNDVLEFLCRLQNEPTRPQRLFDALREKHLLLLGGNFPDWVGRLILRLARSERLANTRSLPTRDTLADTRALGDRELEWFFEHFSKPTVIYPDGGGIAFIDELYKRWSSREPQAAPVEDSAPKPSAPTLRAIFLSYAHEDRRAARVLKNSLEENRIEVWLDETELRGGDSFARKIYRQIDQCALFIPIISSATEARREGWFRREWAHAIQRAGGMHADVPFILPVHIDGTTAGKARWVPDEFKLFQWTSCPEGSPPKTFIDHLSTTLSGG
jgi:hypothetical protein